MTDRSNMREVYWKSIFPQAYQKVRQLPLARNLPPAQWMFLSLENGFLTSEEYLTWARTYYGLAIIETPFFERPFSPATYQKYKDLFHWGPQALPIHEWDGVVFVACVDPHSVPSHLENIVCRPILASYQGLMRGWNLITSQETPSSSLQNKDGANSATHQNHETLSQNAMAENLTHEDFPPTLPLAGLDSEELGSDISLSPADLEPLQQEEAPPLTNATAENEGFPSFEGAPSPIEDQMAISSGTKIAETPPAFEMAPSLELPPLQAVPSGGNLFELVDSSPSIEESELATGKDAENAGEESNGAFEMPEGLDFSMSPSMSPSLTPSSASPSNNPSTGASNNPSAVPVNTESDDPLQAFAAKAAPQTPPPVATQASQPVSPQSMVPTPPPPKATATTPPPKPSIEATQTAARVKIKQPVPPMELEEELKLSFAKAYQSYRNLMILKLKNEMVLPFRWDPSYKNPKVLESIDLSQPSVFRIAAKTKKPFHGAISANDINSEFFNNWFGGHIPTYLTIVPLFFERECVGLLLGAADEQLDRKDSLQLMENTAHKVESNFGARIAS